MHLLRNPAPVDPHASGKLPAHQSVYEKLRSRILFGDLAPGQAVTIQGLTADMDVGMTPVREAIRRLISDGALSMQGNRRVTVPILTMSCIDQLDFMRQTLEPKLTRLAFKHLSDTLVKSLTQHDNALNSAIAQGDIMGYLTHNYRFHSTLYAATEAPILAATVDRLWLRFGPSLRVVCGRYGTLNLPDKHADLLAALALGDEDAAAVAISEDIQQGLDQVRAALGVPPE